MNAKSSKGQLIVGGNKVSKVSSCIRSLDALDFRNIVVRQGRGVEGDLIMARVNRLGSRRVWESVKENRFFDEQLKLGDVVIGILGCRYSTTSEYGHLGEDRTMLIFQGGSVDLLASGGILGICEEVPKMMGGEKTSLDMIGILHSNATGKSLNIGDAYTAHENMPNLDIPILLVTGTSAEVGKTTLATLLIDALKHMGFSRIAGAKLSGTGRLRDISRLRDQGAFLVKDFCDVGFATTYTDSVKYVQAMHNLFNDLGDSAPEVIVAECGGDLLEGNVPALLGDAYIMKSVKGIFHASNDVLGMLGSLSIFKSLELSSEEMLFFSYPYQRNYHATKKRMNALGMPQTCIDPMNNVELTKILTKILQ